MVYKCTNYGVQVELERIMNGFSLLRFNKCTNYGVRVELE